MNPSPTHNSIDEDKTREIKHVATHPLFVKTENTLVNLNDVQSITITSYNCWYTFKNDRPNAYDKDVTRCKTLIEALEKNGLIINS